VDVRTGIHQPEASPRVFLIARAAGKSSMWALRLAGPLAIATVLARRFSEDPGVRFCAATAVATAAIFIGGEGVNGNVFFDAVCALCVCVRRSAWGTLQPRVASLRVRAGLSIRFADSLAMGKNDGV